MKAFIKRTLAVSLCAALLTGAAVSMPALVPDSGITASAYSSGDYEYTVSNNKATITRYYGRSGSVTIPSKIGGYTVTSIGSYAFSYCSSLTSVTIPDSVTSIGYGVFYGCSSLTNVTIPKSVTKIEKMAFGYYTDDNYNSVKIDNFTIYGEEGTAAEEYANDNGFKFVAIEEFPQAQRAAQADTNMHTTTSAAATIHGRPSAQNGVQIQALLLRQLRKQAMISR